MKLTWCHQCHLRGSIFYVPGTISYLPVSLSWMSRSFTMVHKSVSLVPWSVSLKPERVSWVQKSSRWVPGWILCVPGMVLQVSGGNSSFIIRSEWQKHEIAWHLNTGKYLSLNSNKTLFFVGFDHQLSNHWKADFNLAFQWCKFEYFVVSMEYLQKKTWKMAKPIRKV